MKHDFTFNKIKKKEDAVFTIYYTNHLNANIYETYMYYLIKR